MKEFAIFVTPSSVCLPRILGELNIYHGRNFPMLRRDQVYRQIAPDCLIVRANRGWSSGDVLDHLTMTLALGPDERMYCVSIGPDFIRQRDDHSSSYLTTELQAVCDADVQGPFVDSKLAHHLFYLTNYLSMLECDDIEQARFPTGRYVISDRLQSWTSEKAYAFRHAVGPSGHHIVTKTAHATFARFIFSDIDGWLRQCATILGFSLQFVKDGTILDKIDASTFAGVEILFCGERDWKSRVGFAPHAIAARLVDTRTRQWEPLERKSTEYFIVPANALREGSGYEQCIADARRA